MENNQTREIRIIQVRAEDMRVGDVWRRNKRSPWRPCREVREIWGGNIRIDGYGYSRSYLIECQIYA